MAKGRKLLDDVSREELLRMREEEGLSNWEIGMRLGVSKQTIYRIIGKQPPHIRTECGLQAAEKERRRENANQPKQEKEIIPACLVLDMRMYQLQGSFACYRVCDKDRTIQITTASGDQMDMQLENVDDFIRELQAISRHMQKPAPMEAW